MSLTFSSIGVRGGAALGPPPVRYVSARITADFFLVFRFTPSYFAFKVLALR